MEEINDPAVCFGMLTLACKMMRKCMPKKVPAHVIALAGRCEKGVIYNLFGYLYKEFLENVNEA